LLDTVRLMPRFSRLFIVAATWLHAYGDTVAKHRLRRLINDELEPEHQPALGLLLDTAQQGTHPKEFESILKHLRPADPERAIFDASRLIKGIEEYTRRDASQLARKWGLWALPIKFKLDALRPAVWVMSRYPELRARADFRGDLRASVLASLRYDDGAGESESGLAVLAGGSRSQVRSALRNLAMTGRVVVRPADEGHKTAIRLAGAA
jgi:hypothetical protein